MNSFCASCLRVNTHLPTCPDLLVYRVYGPPQPPVVPGPAWDTDTAVLSVVVPVMSDVTDTQRLQPVQMHAEPVSSRHRDPRWAVTLIGLGSVAMAVGVFCRPIAEVLWGMIPR